MSSFPWFEAKAAVVTDNFNREATTTQTSNSNTIGMQYKPKTKARPIRKILEEDDFGMKCHG